MTTPFAKRVIPLLDLTNLDDACTAADVDALCKRAKAAGVAAVCVWPQFVAQAKTALADSRVRVATVVNYPEGDVLSSSSPCKRGSSLTSESEEKTQDEWIPAFAGMTELADEIDFVFPWRAFLAGDVDGARHTLEAARRLAGERLLKVILESGQYPTPESLRAACDLCIDCGADFLKTSTGKTEPGATPDAVRVLCAASRAVAKQVGVKISGGVRTIEQVQDYLKIVEDLLGLNWICADNFRIGASKLLDALEA